MTGYSLSYNHKESMKVSCFGKLIAIIVAIAGFSITAEAQQQNTTVALPGLNVSTGPAGTTVIVNGQVYASSSSTGPLKRVCERPPGAVTGSGNGNGNNNVQIVTVNLPPPPPPPPRPQCFQPAPAPCQPVAPSVQYVIPDVVYLAPRACEYPPPPECRPRPRVMTGPWDFSNPNYYDPRRSYSYWAP